MFFTPSVPEITASELSQRLSTAPETVRLLDIRPPAERAYSNIGGDHIPVYDLPGHLAEFENDEERELVVYCRSGHRSASVVAWLHARGITRARNLAGGINAWSRTVDPAVRAY